jgi:hypothetical protein
MPPRESLFANVAGRVPPNALNFPLRERASIRVPTNQPNPRSRKLYPQMGHVLPGRLPLPRAAQCVRRACPRRRSALSFSRSPRASPAMRWASSTATPLSDRSGDGPSRKRLRWYVPEYEPVLIGQRGHPHLPPGAASHATATAVRGGHGSPVHLGPTVPRLHGRAPGLTALEDLYPVGVSRLRERLGIEPGFHEALALHHLTNSTTRRLASLR